MTMRMIKHAIVVVVVVVLYSIPYLFARKISAQERIIYFGRRKARIWVIR